MRAWWRRVRCSMRGHPLGLSVTTAAGVTTEYCEHGVRPRTDYYSTADGRTWMRGRGPEPWR
jgi:hypothetical protein